MILDSSLIAHCSLLIAAFLSGALPFSVWIGRLALRKDIRNYGDGNPGATNVFRAGGKLWGVAAFLLDTFKAAIPVGLAYFILGVGGAWMVAIALAPIVGHAFSPFLKFRGGKAVAATFGVWIGLTIGEVPPFLGLMLLYWYKGVQQSGWAVLLAMLSLLGYLLLAKGTPLMLAIWAGNTALMAWTHRAELREAPRLQENLWVRRLLKR